MGRKPIEPGPLSLKVAEILLEAKQNRGLNFRDLAEKSSVNRLRIQRCFNGEQHFYIDEISSLSRALGLQAWKVLREAEACLATEQTPRLSVIASTEDEEELPDFSQMAARTVSDEQYQRIMARKRFFDDLGEGVDYDPDGWAD